MLVREQETVQQIVYVDQVQVMAAPLLKRLVAGFPHRRPGFAPRSGQVGFVVDKVALVQVFSE
jgi:hypothetical protein